MELVTPRDVLLRYDRFPGGVLSRRVGRIAVLPSCHLSAATRYDISRLVTLRGGDSAAPRAVDPNFLATDTGIVGRST